jgi:peroxiredoxin
VKIQAEVPVPKAVKPMSLAVLAILGLASCAPAGTSTGGTTAATTKLVGSMATDFAARDTDGKTFRLSDHLGKEAILLDFWATWCEPCMAEMPHLEELYEQNKSKGFLVAAVSMDGPETIADVPMFAKRHNMTFPVILDEDSHVISVYNPKRSAPLSVIIDKKGRIFRLRESYNSGDEKYVAADVAEVLAQP